MDHFIKLLRRIAQEYINLRYGVRAKFASLSERIQNDVPYICQFAVPESSELTLKKQLLPIDDQMWRESGASSPERYALLGPNICGLAAAAMALDYFKGSVTQPAKLAEDAIKSQVYTVRDENLSDMDYRKFAIWVRKFGIRADVYTRLDSRGMQYALSSGGLVMASVNPNIRGYVTSAEDKVGGHIVLVTGYDRGRGTFTINNPSGFVSNGSQKAHVLSEKRFVRYFAGRGIVLSNVNAGKTM